MKKRTSFEAAYDTLSRIGRGPMSDDAMSALRGALSGRTSLLASLAADIVAHRNIHDLIPDMISAFDYYLAGGAKVDKQCSAKISIINALNKLDYLGNEVFRKGARHIQMEPVFGGHVDTAVQLRSGCAYGLARTSDPEAVYILTELLVDADPGVRSAAAKALTYLGLPESEVLLRLKVLTGDKEPGVTRDCFDGLMAMAPDRSLDFVARYLQSEDPAISQYAALAVAGSRLPRAFEVLRECWDTLVLPAAKTVLLVPIALIRRDEAFEFLVDVVRTSDKRVAAEAISALCMYTDSDSVRQIREAVESRRDAGLQRVFDSEFGDT